MSEVREFAVSGKYFVAELTVISLSTAGVVDEDYRGNIGVVLFNHSEVEFPVAKGDRIAQFICERIFYPTLEEVKTLTVTERGDGGFGSTGTN